MWYLNKIVLDKVDDKVDYMHILGFTNVTHVSSIWCMSIVFNECLTLVEQMLKSVEWGKKEKRTGKKEK